MAIFARPPIFAAICSQVKEIQMMQPIKILIADAQCLIRVGLRHLLGTRAQFQIVGEAGNEKQLLFKLKQQQPDVIILDYNQPKYFSSDTVVKVQQASPEAKILIISTDSNRQNIYQVLGNGVNSFLTKACDESEIIDAIRATAKGERFFCNSVLTVILEKSFPKDDCSPTPLTKRQIEVVKLVASGKIAKEIASELNLSTHTIYTHRKNIMKKLKISSSSELVLYAVNNGMLE